MTGQVLTNIVIDGHSTKIDLGGQTLQEITISPPSIGSGGEIEVSSMDNDNWRSKAPKKLHECGEVSFSALYDPAEIGTYLAGVGVNKLIKITFANGDTLKFYGWVDSFSPSEISEGEAPTVDLTIIVSNQDGGVAVGYAGDETAPVWTAGTTTTAAP